MDERVAPLREATLPPARPCVFRSAARATLAGFPGRANFACAAWTPAQSKDARHPHAKMVATSSAGLTFTRFTTTPLIGGAGPVRVALTRPEQDIKNLRPAQLA